MKRDNSPFVLDLSGGGMRTIERGEIAASLKLIGTFAGTVILLCNLTLSMAQPWIDAGYRVVMVDPQHGASSIDGPVERIAGTIIDAMPRLSEIIRTERVVFVFGFPPCTDVAVSGSLHFEAKRAKDIHFQAKAALVAEQCRMIGMAAGCAWGFENPVSVFSSIFGKPQHSFHPYQFTSICLGDNYTKNTQLWTGGGFVMPECEILPAVAHAIDLVKQKFGRMVPKPKAAEFFGAGSFVEFWYPDDRIHKAAPGPDRANFRSATPAGFSKAVFVANRPQQTMEAA